MTNASASSLIAARGLPDWQHASGNDQFQLLGAYGEDGLYFAVPRTAALAVRSDGSPDFFLEFVSDKNAPGPDQSLYAVLRMGLTPGGNLIAAAGLLDQPRSEAALLPMSFNGGNRLHLRVGDSVETAPFAWTSATHAAIEARLSPLSARLLYAALHRSEGGVEGAGLGGLVQTAIECEVAAVLPRLDLQVRFDPGRVLPSLRDHFRGGPLAEDHSLPFEGLVNLLAEPRPQWFDYSGAEVGRSSRDLGLALAGRLLHEFGRAARCTTPSDGPRIQLTTLDDKASAAAGGAAVQWNLQTPLLAGVPVVLRADPFALLAEVGRRDQLTGFTSVPKLPDDLRRRRITVGHGLPAQITHCQQIALWLQVDAADSASGVADTRSVVLYPPPQQPSSRTVDLSFARIQSPQSYRTRVQVVTDDGVAAGPWTRTDADYLFIDASDLPLPLVRVAASEALLRRAAVSFSVVGSASDAVSAGAQHSPQDTAALVSLTPSQPIQALLLDRPDSQTRLRIQARDLETDGPAVLLDLPARSVDLDLTSFTAPVLHTEELSHD